MRLSVLPAHARSIRYAVADMYRGNSDFCRKKSLARREETVSNTFKKCGFMGFLNAVPAAVTACLESLGWTSIDHIGVDAKVWPGIVAMEVGICGLEWPAIFFLFTSAPTASLSILLCMIGLVPAKGRRKGLLTQITEGLLVRHGGQESYISSRSRVGCQIRSKNSNIN